MLFKVLSSNVQNTWIMQWSVQCFEKLFRQLLSSAADFTYVWVKHGGGRSELSGLVLITKTTGVEPTEVEDGFTEDTMPNCPDDQNCNKFAEYLLENYIFKLTKNSSTHFIPLFSYLTNCIKLLRLSTTLITPN